MSGMGLLSERGKRGAFATTENTHRKEVRLGERKEKKRRRGGKKRGEWRSTIPRQNGCSCLQIRRRPSTPSTHGKASTVPLLLPLPSAPPSYVLPPPPPPPPFLPFPPLPVCFFRYTFHRPLVLSTPVRWRTYDYRDTHARQRGHTGQLRECQWYRGFRWE